MHALLQVSKISLVDLAGSERADSTGAKGTRLKVTCLNEMHVGCIHTETHITTCPCLWETDHHDYIHIEEMLYSASCFITGRSKYQ